MSSSAKGITLERHFVPTEQPGDPDYFWAFGYFLAPGYQRQGVKNWEDLLKASPTVVLAEGRAGKTYEFQSQVKKLKSENKYAFFVPLECLLHNEDLKDALAIEDISDFEKWKESTSEAEGYFFLDALDELKLIEGTLGKAIKKIRNAIEDTRVNRANIVISCRPADWKSEIDRAQLTKFCITASTDRTEFSEDSEMTLRNIISRGNALQKEESSAEPEKVSVDRSKVQILSLLPLDNSEIQSFAKGYSPKHSKKFIDHLQKNDLWHLHRLPIEIKDALDYIKNGHTLGQLEEQISFGVQEKLKEQECKRPSLSLDKALEGAQRIALALFLLKRRSLKINGKNNPDALNVSDILTDWNNAEQKELIRRPLFDSSGIGAVRFHHRSSQEYLAAKRLAEIKKDMRPDQFFELIFSEIGDEKVVKPSMAPVAAWLALWLTDVRKQILEREPSLLFMQGLPGAFSSDLKKEILNAYVSRYSNKEWCGTHIDIDNLKRLASPELGETVRKLWEKGYTGYNSRELLLELIRLGEISGCTDLAFEAALDKNIQDWHQVYAAWGVLVAGTDEQKQILAEKTLALDLDQKVIRNILPQLVPQLISVNEANLLFDKLEQTSDSVHGLNYTIYQISKNDKISRADLICLRDYLANAIWRGWRDNCEMYNENSVKNHYKDGLIAACVRSIPDNPENTEDWARAVAIITHFGKGSILAEEETKTIWSTIKNNVRLRESYFWACLNLSDDLEVQKEDSQRFFSFTVRFRERICLNTDDQEWLLAHLSRPQSNGNRGIVFTAVTFFFDLRKDPEFREAVIEAVRDRPDWLEKVNNILNSKPQEPDKFEIGMKDERAQKEEERINNWREWRSEVLADPDFLMGGESRLNVLYNVQEIIRQDSGNYDALVRWNSGVIEKIFGSDFLERLRKELSIFWRETEVKLPGELPEDKRNTIYGNWILAHTAVQAESEVPGWAGKLTPEEAVHVARISCIGLKGFGSLYTDLDQAHPEAFAQVIFQEASAQLLQTSDTNKTNIFLNVSYYGTDNMKSALATKIASQLSNLGDVRNLQDKIDYAIRIIASHGRAEDKNIAIKALEKHIDGNHTWPTGLSLLAILDPELGCRKLLEKTKNLETEAQCTDAISAFMAVFGQSHQRVIDLDSIPKKTRISLIKELVLRSFQLIHCHGDISHEDLFIPNKRDNAQFLQSYLFKTLIDIKQPEVLSILHEFAEKSEFSHMPDRLHQMAYEIAAQISDTTPYSLENFKKLDRKGVFTPFDDRSLFVVMMTLLGLFGHDILNAEDTPIETLLKVAKESEFRRFIAYCLRKSDCKGVFDFTQEAVVYNDNRTDIRLYPKSMNHYATVELKLETCSVRDLEEALTNQLVDKYLQHQRCRVGCLLICQRKNKKWKEPNGGKMWSLSDVVGHLQEIAKGIMSKQPGLHLDVKGIDFSEK